MQIAAPALVQTSIGKKVLMAVTGFIMTVFVVVHMVGNLQVYAGPERLNHYADLLRVSMPVLWTARATLFLSLLVHLYAALDTTLQSWKARATRYHVVARRRAATWGSLSMRYSGIALLAFVLYHVLHLTFGVALPDYIPGDVYHNVIAGFLNPFSSAIYIVMMVFLGLHMVHGVWSMWQTLGLGNSVVNRALRAVSTLLTLAVVLGNISIPVAVLAGFVR